jgi:hypothetical protein
MKKLIITCFIGVVTLMSSNCFAQCDTKTIKKNIVISLDDYNFESLAYKELISCNDKKVVRATFEIFKGEQYRLVDVSQGFTGKIMINLYDSKDKIFMSNFYESNNIIFDFTAKNSGEYMIEYIFENKDSNQPNGKCIAFGIGYK